MSFPDNTFTVKLSVPIPASDGTSIEEVTMREPRVRDRVSFSKASGSDEEREAGMIADLCSLTKADIFSLTAYDYSKLLDVFNVFMLPPERRKLPKF